jgi:phosphatidate phosphatase LPIN
LSSNLHSEVILRKPEVFKMACLRDIQRLFGGSKVAFYAGFGNRITDAMSYRSVNIPSSRIFTIDSNGEVKTELLELAGYKSSFVVPLFRLYPLLQAYVLNLCRSLFPRYIYMNDLVDQMFPPVHARWAPEFTDFNFWRPPTFSIELPDLSPPSPALSARSDTSGGRLSVLRNFTGSLRGSRSGTPVNGSSTTGGDANKAGSGGGSRGGSGPSSPLFGPAWTSDNELSEEDDEEADVGSGGKPRRQGRADSMPGSLPGSLGDDSFFDDPRFDLRAERDRRDGDEVEQEDDEEQGEPRRRNGDGEDDDDDDDGEGDGEDGGDEEEEDEMIFDDDLDAMGEMGKVAYL